MTLYRPEIRILTAENPIEYVYEQFSQSEVNERIGNTFASYLRGFLRHDPDVIMVGEIRDEDTAGMSLRAAQTGHLVLSTLHTTTAIGCVPAAHGPRRGRQSPGLVAPRRAVATSRPRGLRRRAGHRIPRLRSCSVSSSPSPPAHAQWMIGRGCTACHFTGYKGRMAIAELWLPSEQDVVLISKGAPFDEIRESSRRGTDLRWHVTSWTGCSRGAPRSRSSFACCPTSTWPSSVVTSSSRESAHRRRADLKAQPRWPSSINVARPSRRVHPGALRDRLAEQQVGSRSGAAAGEDRLDQIFRNVARDFRLVVVEGLLPEADRVAIVGEIRRAVHTPAQMPFELGRRVRLQLARQVIRHELRELTTFH